MLEGVDAVVDLAAISNDPMGNKFEEITLDVNYRAAVELAKKAKKAGVKIFCVCFKLQHVRSCQRLSQERE